MTTPPLKTPRLVAPQPPRSIWKRRLGKPNLKDWLYFNFQLRTLLDSGFPIVQAFQVLTESMEREQLKRLAADMGEHLAKGWPLAQALDAHKKEVPEFMRSVLLVGQRSGDFNTALDLLIRHFQWMVEIRSEIFRVVWYPAVMIVLGTLIMTARDTIIATMYGGDLLPTFLRISAHYCVPIILACLFAYSLAKLLRGGFKETTDRAFLMLPFVGNLFRKYSIAVFLEMFSTTLEAGSPLVDGYEISARAVPNKHISEQLLKRTYFLHDGETITDTLKLTGVFDQHAIGMIYAGEIGASSDSMMKKLASYYETEIHYTVKVMIRLTAPFYLPLIAGGFFVNPAFLGILAFILVVFYCML